MVNKFLCSVLSGFFCLYCLYGCEQIGLAIKAAEIHEKILTVDTHADTPFLMGFFQDYDLGQYHDPSDNDTVIQVDFPRMKKGGLDAIFFVAFVLQGDRSPADNLVAKNKAMSKISLVHEAVDANPDLAELALTPEDAGRIEKTGKRAVYIGMENGYPIGDDLTLIEGFYGLGVRYIGLSHTSNNDICDSSTDPEGPEHNGLSSFGEQVVAEMNRLGIMVDISHASDETVRDVLEISTAPIIASHSLAREVYDHPRNLPDDLMVEIAESGGVIQATFYYEFVKELEPDQSATVSDFVDHIDHVVGVAGIDHVGIGSDFDGGAMLSDCSEVSELGNITLELVRRGYTETDIEKIWGGNLMRVFYEVEMLADNSTSI